ncbi:hypothetical protein LWI29_030490 [Acer saccharum]|uniref:Uncharacterized protein n=1 Tax=Acer saccharum TaxID=4024 RepID=A0AA39SDN8_ACESA|nr:hypothetical protein LWI29_030490 [Acer saccharum]KAK1576280.1 hypothetical protein Q3G72_012625 [Acer saccharum]
MDSTEYAIHALLTHCGGPCVDISFEMLMWKCGYRRYWTVFSTRLKDDVVVGVLILCGKNVNAVFDAAIKAVLQPPKPKKQNKKIEDLLCSLIDF